MAADTVILLPYYRRLDALQKTLASLQTETAPFDLLIVDDGSPEPLALNAADYHFPIKIIRMPVNGGITRALNAGLEYILAQNYEFIARLDAGDRWVPGRLAAQRDFLRAQPDYGLVGCCLRFIHSDGSFAKNWNVPLSDRAIRRFMYFNNAILHPAAMMRAATVRRAGFYSEDFPAAEDYEYFRRLLKFGKAANLPERYLDCEIGLPGESISADNQRRQIQTVIKTQLHYFNPFAWEAYAGLAYKLLHLYAPGAAQWIKKTFRNGN